MKKMLTLILIFVFSRLVLAPEYHTLIIMQTSYEASILNWINIDFQIWANGIKEPEIVKKQIRLETGNLTSRFCREGNNLFGMKKAQKRKTKAIDIDNSMSVYYDWRESIEDYKIWQDIFYKGGNYYEFLKEIGYATDKDYILKLVLLN